MVQIGCLIMIVGLIVAGIQILSKGEMDIVKGKPMRGAPVIAVVTLMFLIAAALFGFVVYLTFFAMA